MFNVKSKSCRTGNSQTGSKQLRTLLPGRDGWLDVGGLFGAESDAQVAGESGVASRSAGFATAVQNALVAAAAIGESKCGLHWLGDGGRKTWMEIN